MKLNDIFFVLILFSMLMFSYPSAAQKNNCIFKDAVYTLDFGTVSNFEVPVFYNLENYQKTSGSCPENGYYSFGTSTKNCFEDKWHIVNEDHTPGDVNGKMMIINGSGKPGIFFVMTIAGLKPGATYRISEWFVNISKYTTGCTAVHPSIEINILANDEIIASFKTGEIKLAEVAKWQQFTGEFVMDSKTDVITLQMKDLTSSDCGNDFAVDDIEITQCSQPLPEQVKTENSKPIQETFASTLPKVIETRANPVIQQITTEEVEMNIELYDNGEIDGDTVSIYHNNELVVSHAGISTKPVTLKIKVDKLKPHHELVMVADNLGRIPPNTSLMIITAGKKRYEIFISSSEQKNAKVIIDLK